MYYLTMINLQKVGMGGQEDIGFKQKKITVYALFWKLWKEKNYSFPDHQHKQT